MAPFTDRTYIWAHGVCAYSISPHCHTAKKREFVCKACWQAASEELQEDVKQAYTKGCLGKHFSLTQTTHNYTQINKYTYKQFNLFCIPRHVVRLLRLLGAAPPGPGVLRGYSHLSFGADEDVLGLDIS